jgi:hypothetical protein
MTASIMTEREALIDRAAFNVEEKQRIAFGRITCPADRKLLASLSDHDLENIIYGIGHNPMSYALVEWH